MFCPCRRSLRSGAGRCRSRCREERNRSRFLLRHDAKSGPENRNRDRLKLWPERVFHIAKSEIEIVVFSFRSQSEFVVVRERRIAPGLLRLFEWRRSFGRMDRPFGESVRAPWEKRQRLGEAARV